MAGIRVLRCIWMGRETSGAQRRSEETIPRVWHTSFLAWPRNRNWSMRPPERRPFPVTTRSSDLFCYRLCLREQIQVVGAAGFGIGAGHVEAAERVSTDHRSRALAVDVEVAYVEVAAGAVDLIAGFSI